LNYSDLAERQAEVRAGDYLKKESAVAPTMNKLAGQRTPQLESAQDEWSGMESEFLPSASALLADEAN